MSRATIHFSVDGWRDRIRLAWMALNHATVRITVSSVEVERHEPQTYFRFQIRNPDDWTIENCEMTFPQASMGTNRYV